MSIARTLVVLLMASLSPLVMAAPCAGFTDVDSASSFCADVTWIANRGITVGCSAGLYCPGVVVNRLSMAAFLRRLGERMYARNRGTQYTQTTPLASGATQVVSSFGWPLGWHVLWRVVPTTTGSFLAVTNVSYQNDGDGTGTYLVTVHNQGAAAAAYELSYSVLE
jgi:hypothetical protein